MRTPEPELYFSIDIEANGPIPGPNSMLSLGAAAITIQGQVLGDFQVNFEELAGSSGDPDTMEWWSKQPLGIWDACRTNPQPPKEAMQSYVDWVAQLAGEHTMKPVCVAYPAGFDFMSIHWYSMRFLNFDPFSFSCLDLKSFAMAKLGTPYRGTTKKTMPKAWFKDLPKHTHVAKEDALEQGLIFINMLNHAKP